MARAKTRRGGTPEDDALARVERLIEGVIRVAGLVKQVQAMPDGATRRRLMAEVDRLIVVLKQAPL